MKAQVSNVFSQNKTVALFINQAEVLKLESPELSIIQKSSLKGIAPTQVVSSKVLGSLVGSDFESKERKEIIEYTVQPGETISGIADNFGISINTLLWANDLAKNSLIKPGQKLIILPISGVMHLVRSGDTLTGLAKQYKGKTEEIVEFNELSGEGEIFIGDLLIIPNGQMPPKQTEPQYAPLATHYFICPIPAPCRLTQGLHTYNAVDFSHGKCGESVYAAAGGEVQKVGYSKITGIYVRILHPNGIVTFYGHLSKSQVAAGDRVYQGQIIGYIGYSGYTIPAGPAGCHLHFEVRGARNPFAQ